MQPFNLAKKPLPKLAAVNWKRLTANTLAHFIEFVRAVQVDGWGCICIISVIVAIISGFISAGIDHLPAFTVVICKMLKNYFVLFFGFVVVAYSGWSSWRWLEQLSEWVDKNKSRNNYE